MMSKPPSQGWLAVLERRKSGLIFLVEWLALFLMAWMFWSVMFWAAPGAVSPTLAALAVSSLYATAMIYGRVHRATGCKRCSSPVPFRRKEIGRRRLPDREDCMEVQYGAEEYGQVMIQDYCRVLRTDMVTYRCRSCGQMWEERIELQSTQYQPVHRNTPK